MSHIYAPIDSPILDLDDAQEAYAGREAIEIDDFGNEFECCTGSDTGHLFKTECGATVCVHCGEVAWQ